MHSRDVGDSVKGVWKVLERKGRKVKIGAYILDANEMQTTMTLVLTGLN